MVWKNDWEAGDPITSGLLNDLAGIVNAAPSADPAGSTHAATSKTTPVDADELPLVDSAASNVLKKLTWANLKATLKTYFDSLATTLTNKTIALGSNTISGTTAQFNTANTDADFYTSGGADVLITDGGTGVSTLPTGILKGAGTGAITAASNTTDYVSPTAVHATTAKTTPVVGDEMVFLDSAASFVPVRVLVSDFFTVLLSAIASSVMTLTNKAITPRVNGAASAGNVAFDVLINDQINLTAQAAPITAYTPSNTPVDGQEIWFRIKDNGTARAIARGSSFISGPATMITTTVAGKTHLEMFKYDSAAAKWVCCISHLNGY